MFEKTVQDNPIMTTTDSEVQRDELDALKSILDEATFEIHEKSTDAELTHGTLVIEIILADGFFIHFHQDQRRRIEHLPPLFLRFSLPSDYPSKSPPHFQLECIWMNHKQLDLISKNLVNLWLDNNNEPVLFLWYTSSSTQALEWLDLTTTLDLTQSFPSTTANSSLQQLSSIQIVATILNYEQEKKMLILSRTLITCPICLVEVHGGDCFLCYSCSGTACKSCIKLYLDIRISAGEVRSITCPIDPSCQTELTPVQIASVVDQQTFHRYDRLLFQLSIDSMNDVTYCPRCHKPVIITRESEDPLQSSLGECVTCSFAFCTICRKTFHGINPCQYTESQMKEIFEEYRNATVAQQMELQKKYGKNFYRLMDEMASTILIKKTARQCPQCHIFVDKLNGCNKMTCIKCHSYFCWTCLQLLSKTDPYGHFNRPDSKCFNKLFEGVVDLE